MGEVRGSIPFRAYHLASSVEFSASALALSTAPPARRRLSAKPALENAEGIMQTTSIGDFEVHRVTEYEGPFLAPQEFFPDFDPEVLRANADLLGPKLIDPDSGRLMFSFHTFVIKTGRHTILIDSCLGNDKERPTRPQFHRMRSNYLADLAAAGVRPEQVDFVMCTHLHWDHVGWNTRLENGSWVPTFPKARYIMARREYNHWEGAFRQPGEELATSPRL